MFSPVIPSPITDLWYGTRGPRDAKIAVVAESWGATEAYMKKPLVGQSGQEFDRMLRSAKIDPEAILFTNCFAAQPPSNEVWRFFNSKKSGGKLWRGLQPTKWVEAELLRLQAQLEALQPRLVIALGNYALWALTGEAHVSFSSAPTGEPAESVIVPTGISSWRGSMLTCGTIPNLAGCPLLPVIHPASVLRAWTERAVVVHDLSARVPLALSGDWRPSPPPTIHSEPTYETARKVLSNWLVHAAVGNVLRLSHDIETARGLITCMAFADGPYAGGATALVIPFVRPGSDGSFGSYWTQEQEFELIRLCKLLLEHPNVKVEGQNYNYDTQWLEAMLGIAPICDFDTMLAHHLLWPGTPKALDYLASLYNHYYWYWKDDNKEWDVKGNFSEHLRYNAEDALRTFECATELRRQVIAQGFSELWKVEQQKNLMAMDMMRRGVKIDRSKRTEMAFHLEAEKERINSWLAKIIPQSILVDSGFGPKTSKKMWWESSDQQKTLFFDVLGLPGQKNKKTGRPSLDAAALEVLKAKHPEFMRIWDALEMQRSISVFSNTFIGAELEPDGRMKCSFNTAGTETFRWSSSTNAFWRGTNLQNIPRGEEE